MRGVTIGVMRYLLAAVFIFSGFVKSVDPWGTAIKLDEYLYVMGLDWLSGGAFLFAIALSGAELALGLALALGIRRRESSLCIMLFMAFFTLLTLWIAIYSPVEDCGCFGDAVKLTNWQTFIKNLILLPMSIMVWLSWRSTHESAKRWLLLTAIFALSCGVGLYSYLHLPIIDFLPYKVGTNLAPSASAIDVGHGQVQTTLIYKNITTGQRREFSLTDTEWQDESTWEFVETKVDFGGKIEHKSTEFTIFNDSEDVTSSLLNGRVYLLTVTDLATIPAPCAEVMQRVVRAANDNNIQIFIVTPSTLPKDGVVKIGGQQINCYNIDALLLKTIIRAKNGVVELDNGVIVSKKNCTDWHDC